MVLRLMLINSVFWKPQFQGGVLKRGGDVRENSGPVVNKGTLGICPKLYYMSEATFSVMENFKSHLLMDIGYSLPFQILP
jgi:hypothetical protein